MTTLTISSKGWVVIPAPMREKYNLRAGSQVRVVDYGGVLSLVPVLENPIEQSAGALKVKGRRSLTKALREEHRKERAHERRKRR